MTTFPRSGFRRRLGAWVYDSLIVIAIYMIVGLIASALLTTLISLNYIVIPDTLTPSDYAANSIIFKAILNSLALVLIIYFFIYFWSKSGQTLGMRAWRLRVQQQNGELMLKATAIKRLLISLFGLGSLWVIVNRKEKLSLQDKLTNTEVVVLSLEANKGAKWSNGE